MKPEGYVFIMESGIRSGSAHISSLDFWRPKGGDTVESLWSASQVREFIKMGIGPAEEIMKEAQAAADIHLARAARKTK